MHFIRMNVSFICFRVAKHTFNQKVIEQCFTTSRITTSPQVTQGNIKSSILQWEDAEYTVFDSHSTNQITTEIDFAVDSESRLSHSVGEEDDSNQEASQSQVSKSQKP